MFRSWYRPILVMKMKILDATCGKRMMWFDKTYKDAIYIDIRKEVKPQIIADDKKLPFKDNIFDLIIFDPPHVSTSPNSNMGRDFGGFKTREIKELVKNASKEFFRVLKDDGFLLFKWNTHDIKLEKVLDLMKPYFKPLFGQRVAIRTKHASRTYWVCLIKRKI